MYGGGSASDGDPAEHDRIRHPAGVRIDEAWRMDVEREARRVLGVHEREQPKNALMCQSEAPAAWARRNVSPVLIRQFPSRF